ncbi:MAG TPA: PIN domain-containing protein [Bryobacteraceae bacterium]|nr:PIN domain-containing protein [Bryobacteraceae bacterium]
MTVFVDTSAFYAIFDRDDAGHPAADKAWKRLLVEPVALLTSNYVLIETSALLQHRLGIAALRAFHEDIVPVLTVEWVSEAVHRAAVEATLTAARKKLSLVDCASFHIMRTSGVETAFCFDQHFREQGFAIVP